MILITKSSDQTRQKGYILSACCQFFYVSPKCLVVTSLPSFHFLGYLGHEQLNRPCLVPGTRFFLFSPKYPTFPTLRLQLLRGLLRFLVCPPPSPIPVLVPVPVPVYAPLVSFPSPHRSCFHLIFVPVPVPAPSPLPSQFPSYLHSLASTPVSVPAPSPSSSSFPLPTPSRSPLPPSTPIPPPTLFVLSYPSDSVTPSVQYACTDTAPCKRSCRVPETAFSCLQR